MDNLKKTCSPVIIQYKVFKQQKFGFYSLNNIVTAVTMRRMCISVKRMRRIKEKIYLDPAICFLLFCNLYVIKPNVIQASEEFVIP